jgi:ATP-dependent RNA helicase RhlE
MLNLGFREQIINLLEKIPTKRQNLMFSATLTSDVRQLIQEYFKDPILIEIAAHGTPIEKIIQEAYHVPNFNTKANLLEHLIKNDSDLSKVLVFVSTKKLADRLYEQMAAKFPNQTGVIHSNKSQNFRLNVLKQFTDGEIRMLIATDIIARGLDICDVSHVINFDMPEVAADYIHRIGRTGRADKDGIAISFVNEIEQEYQIAIEQLMNRPIAHKETPNEVEISIIYSEEERPTISLERTRPFTKRRKKTQRLTSAVKRKGTPSTAQSAKPPDRQNQDSKKFRT